MAPRNPILLLALAPLLACGGEPEVAAPAPPEAPVAVAGTYRVQGLTTVIGSEESREISGTVVLAQDGENYTASFNLETIYPSPDGPLPAEVVGNGEGTVSGDTLTGTARTQIVASQIPGIDSRFTMIPTTFGVRIVSNSVGTVKDDGSISIAIQNQPAEGETYLPTRTTIRGVRIDPSLPDPHPAPDEGS